MKPFWWLILTTCVGAWWLPPVAPGPACASPSATGTGRGPSLARADRPGPPGGAPEFAWEATEPDPEAAGDGEARLIGHGGARAVADRRGAARPARSLAPPGGPRRGGWRPPSFPIRC